MSPETARNGGQRRVEQDEVGRVLAALRELYQSVTSPMIRACLESTRDDIAYLAATGGPEVSREEVLEELEGEDE
jgi:hypothetical protein